MEVDNWEYIAGRFREHFGNGEQEKDSVKYISGSSSLEISRSGEIRAEMPLHSFSSDSFEKVKFLGDSVRIHTRETVYEFRK